MGFIAYILNMLVWVGVGIFTVYTELQWDKYICDFFTRQTNVVIACFWRDMGFVASTRFCRESGFVANTRFFGFVLSRLLLRHKGFYSDFVQISAQKLGGWDLWLHTIQGYEMSQRETDQEIVSFSVFLLLSGA